MKIRRLSTRLVLWLLPTTAAILIGAVVMQFIQARAIVIDDVRQKSKLLADLAEAELHRLLDPVEASVNTIAAQIPEARLDNTSLKPILFRFLRSTPTAYGSTIALEPGALGPDSVAMAPYYFRAGASDEFQFADLALRRQGFRDEEWYADAFDAMTSQWSAPYYDEGGGETLMITYSVPFKRPIDGKLQPAGVMTADVALDEIAVILADAVEPAMEVMIIDGNGRLISHPNREWIFYETLETLDSRLPASQLATLGRDNPEGIPVPYVSPHLGGPAVAFSNSLDVHDWKLILGIDNNEMMAEAIDARNRIIAITIAGLVALVGLIALIASRITQPVELLAATTRTIARGDLEVEIPVARGHDEIAGLQNDFIQMRDSLRDNIAELQRETETRQKLESELEIARDIQMGLLPNNATIGGALRGVEIAARLIPAKAVGGDLFNYFYTDDSHLCFAVGDVSDKGVPAALFMARTNTLVSTVARHFKAPDAVLGWMSTELSRGNGSCMFVTLLCAIIDVESGDAVIANAAHLEVLFIGTDGSIELREVDAGPPLGVMEGATFPRHEFHLEEGETIVLFTDGVTEAMNSDGELFDNERLVEAARELADRDPTGIAAGIVEAVQKFAGEAPQSDDLTLLVLRRTSTNSEASGA